MILHVFVNNIKGTRIQSQFLFLMEKSILYAKITVSKKIVSKLSFKYYIGLGLFFIVTIMSQISIKA